MSEQDTTENCQACGSEHFTSELKSIKLSGLNLGVLSVCESCFSKDKAASSFKGAAEILNDIVKIANSSNDPERRIRAIKALIGEQLAEYFDRTEDYAAIRWAKEVKLRDHFCCDVCFRKGGTLHAHHKNAWASHPSQRYEMDNGVTLCQFHHEDFHKRYGKGKNTARQYEEYRGIARVLFNVVSEKGAAEFAAIKMLQQAERDRAVRDIMADMKERYGNRDGYEDPETVTSTDIIVP